MWKQYPGDRCHFKLETLQTQSCWLNWNSVIRNIFSSTLLGLIPCSPRTTWVTTRSPYTLVVCVGRRAAYKFDEKWRQMDLCTYILNKYLMETTWLESMLLLSHTRVTGPDKRELGSRFHGGPPRGSLGPDTIKATNYMGASWVHGHG